MNSEWLPYIPSDDIYLFNTGHARKAWLSFGCRYIPELQLHRFLVWAPNARSVTVVGDFNDWHWDDTPMEKLEGGVWVAFLANVWDGSATNTAWRAATAAGSSNPIPLPPCPRPGSETASIVW